MRSNESVLCPSIVTREEYIEVLESSKAFVQAATVEGVTLDESARNPMLNLIEIDRRIRFNRAAIKILRDSCPLNHTDEDATEAVGRCKSEARDIFPDTAK